MKKNAMRNCSPGAGDIYIWIYIYIYIYISEINIYIYLYIRNTYIYKFIYINSPPPKQGKECAPLNNLFSYKY